MAIFLYRWTDTITGMMYIGVHKGTLDDGYVCSSKVMLPVYKERPDTFIREVLVECDSYEKILEEEHLILSRVDAANNPLYYNQHNGGGPVFDSTKPKTERHKLNIASAHKGKKRTVEARRNMSLAQRKRFSRKEEREKLSIARIGNKNCLGRIISNETRKKISDAKKNRLLRQI